MKKTAFLFPGQGSQKVGMGHEFYQEYDSAKKIFDMACESAGKNISKICFTGPMDELTATVNLQPAVTAVNLACLAALKKNNVIPAFTAGHSLGEYSALCASGIITPQDTLNLVHKRGQLMHREAEQQKGIMHAVIGISIEEIKQIILEAKKNNADMPDNATVSIANHNTATQIVITGDPVSVARVSALAAEKKAKSIQLNVSGAWHSELMGKAQSDFQKLLETISFNSPTCPIVLNVTADTSHQPNEIKKIMSKQLCSSVRWHESMLHLIEQNVENFIEVGPGKVLSGILKKTMPKDSQYNLFSVSDLKSLDNCLNSIA